MQRRHHPVGCREQLWLLRNVIFPPIVCKIASDSIPGCLRVDPLRLRFWRFMSNIMCDKGVIGLQSSELNGVSWRRPISWLSVRLTINQQSTGVDNPISQWLLRHQASVSY